jgi:C6 transcription factor Pro1
LTSYFFSVVKIYQGTGQQICGSYTWEALQRQTDLALRKAQRDLDEVNQNGISNRVLESVNLLVSVVNLLTVEVITGSNENWQVHLDAASLLFQQLLSSQKNNQTRPAFSFILELLGSRSFPTTLAPNLWMPDQAAFRFFAADLIFNDIIASTALEKPPNLSEHYGPLLGNGPNPDQEPCLQLADFFGCQNWALVAIGEIATLGAWKKAMKQVNQLSVTELVQRGTAIDQLLLDGLATLDAPGPPDEHNLRGSAGWLDTLSPQPPGVPDKTDIITRIWALSARSYLLVTISGWQLANGELRANVAQTISLFAELAATPTWLRTLAWPLCVTGCLSDSGEEAVMRQLLTDVGGLEAFGTLRQALNIMEHVWRNRSQLDTENWDLGACLSSLGHRALLV